MDASTGDKIFIGMMMGGGIIYVIYSICDMFLCCKCVCLRNSRIAVESLQPPPLVIVEGVYVDQ
tara:strand:+ start:836 stop:1027 length:192 start_codon:yes stop_codon:yes gene_type:complete